MFPAADCHRIKSTKQFTFMAEQNSPIIDNNE